MDLQLSTPDGATITPTPVNPDADEFARIQDAMRSAAQGNDAPAEPAAPPKRAEAPAPAEDKPKRAEAPAPAEDKPKRGRPRKDPATKPRTTTTPAKAPAADTDYTAAAKDLVYGTWIVAAGLPPTQPYAALLDAQADPLAAALAEGAKHSDGIRQWLTGSSEHAWKIHLASVGANLLMGGLQLARDPALREQARQVTKAKLDALMAAEPEAAPAAT